MNELLRTATRLVQEGDELPSQTDIRRAVSTTYYALFHELAELCADQIAGYSSDRVARPDWVRVYRALEHGRVETVIRELDPDRRSKARRDLPSPVEWQIETFVETFERLKSLRHSADYDPTPFTMSALEVQVLIDDAVGAIMFLDLASPAAKRELAFACIVARRRV